MGCPAFRQIAARSTPGAADIRGPLSQMHSAVVVYHGHRTGWPGIIAPHLLPPRARDTARCVGRIVGWSLAACSTSTNRCGQTDHARPGCLLGTVAQAKFQGSSASFSHKISMAVSMVAAGTPGRGTPPTWAYSRRHQSLQSRRWECHRAHHALTGRGHGELGKAPPHKSEGLRHQAAVFGGADLDADLVPRWLWPQTSVRDIVTLTDARPSCQRCCHRFDVDDGLPKAPADLHRNGTHHGHGHVEEAGGLIAHT